MFINFLPNNIFGQECLGLLEEDTPDEILRFGQSCDKISDDYINNYRLMESYIPDMDDTPIKYVNVNFNIWQKDDGTGSFENIPEHIERLNTIANWVSESFFGANIAPSDPRDGVIDLPHTKIKIVLTGIYFYQNTQLYNSGSGGSLNSAVISEFPERKSSLNIHFMASLADGGSGYTAYPSTTNGDFGDRYVVEGASPSNPGADWATAQSIAHELSHNFGLLHLYEPTCCHENCDINNIDFLSDVFDLSLPLCSDNCVCFHDYGWDCDVNDPTNTCTNNMMGGTKSQRYFSPLQLGRMHRAFSLRNVRKYTWGYSEVAHNITSDELWDFSFKTYKDIVVKSGATLTITCELQLVPQAKVVIEKGGRLILDGGVITRGVNSTEPWQGIYVQGDKTLRQSPSSNMGQLIIKNGGTIEYAATAVHNYALDEDGNIDWNSTGGIIKTYGGAQFLNNKRDVEFLSYQNYAGSSPVNDKSYFKETTFSVTEILPDEQQPLDRITMWQVDGIKIWGCDFSSSTEYVLGLRGSGISANDASFVVESYEDTPTTFTNLTKGIEVENYNDYYTISVNKAQFNNLYAGIFMLDVMEASITENTFNVLPSLLNKSPYGLFMVGCSGYKVEENVFSNETSGETNSLGIVVSNKNLEADNDLYRNEFFDLNTGILVMGANGNGSIFEPTGLEVLCNRFTNSLSSYTDFGLTNKGSVSFQQGKDNGQANGPAGNIFSAMACNHENSLFVSDDSFYYTYNHHSNPEATPGSGCYTTNHVLLNGVQIDYTNWETEACPSKLGSDDEIQLPSKKLAVEDSKATLTVLKAEYETVVDGGGSTDLLAVVENPLNSSYAVRSELKSASPYLSDEVLDAAILRNPALNAWHLAEIMMANAPVSPMVWETFEQNTTMPDFLFNYVYYYQENGGTSSRAELEMQMKTQVDIKEKASSDYVRGQMLIDDNENKNQKILELYAVDNDNLAIRRKVAAMVSSGDFSSARELLSAYNENPVTDAYATVQGMVIDINETGNNPTAGEINTLYTIANGEKFGKYKAQAILAQVDGAEFEHPIVLPDPNQKSGVVNKKGSRPVEIVPILASYPNPGDKLMHFTFQLPAELNSAIIEVYNIDGRLMEQIDVSAGIGIYEYDTANLKAGTYISSLLVNGDKVATHKFQVQH